MNTEREEAKKAAKEKQSRKSKYIERLLDTAEKRKKDYERHLERQIQKEREAEGDKYKDKESFVTASYRAKLEEMKIAEEADKRQDYLESIGDVTKQRDLGGFYRHLYEQKMGPEKKEQPSKSTDDTNEANEIKDKEELKTLKINVKKARTYRKRISNENDAEDGSGNEVRDVDVESTEKKTHIQSNIDADSDFSIDDSDSDNETPNKEDKSESKESKKATEVNALDVKSELKPPSNDDFVKPEPVKNAAKKEPSVEKQPPPKPKIDIWKKRTVGEVFDNALQRYYERKQLKSQ